MNNSLVYRIPTSPFHTLKGQSNYARWYSLTWIMAKGSKIQHLKSTGLVNFVVVQSVSCVDSFWPHGLQHARLPCPSPFPRARSNSCPLSRWCHPTISSSVVLSSCLQSFPASGSLLMDFLNCCLNSFYFIYLFIFSQFILIWTNFFYRSWTGI